MNLLHDTITRINKLDADASNQARMRQDTLTKPAGSLGVLEDISIRLAGITGNIRSWIDNKTVIVMAADHGVTEEGVSAFPKEVTQQMVLNFVNGGAAINVLSRHVGAEVIVVDVGVASEIDHPSVMQRKIRYGTANFAMEEAMTRAEAIRSIEVGIEVVEQAIAGGAQCIATGEMGIGNTTASSAILCALTNEDIDRLVGFGTGIENTSLKHKKKVIEQALEKHKPDSNDPIDVLSKVGGLEIGALAGVILGASASRIPVVIDGFISSVAALLARRLEPLCQGYMFASHLSVEPGHAVALRALELEPILVMNMRLGEGTGAVLAMDIIDAAVKILREMATFEEAGVNDRERD